jgi:hypothetical protein
VPGDEGHDVATSVVAVGDTRRRHAVRHLRVQVDERAHDDAAEQAVDSSGEQAPKREVVVAATALRNAAYAITSTRGPQDPNQLAARRHGGAAHRIDPHPDDHEPCLAR